MRHFDIDGPILQTRFEQPAEPSPEDRHFLALEDLVGGCVEFELAAEPRHEARPAWF